MTPLTVDELVERFTLDQLRTAYDTIPTAAIFAEPDTPVTFTVDDVEYLASPNAIGDAKLKHRGWI